MTMKVNLVGLVLPAVAAILCLTILIRVEAQEEMLCRGQKLNMTTEQMSFITTCLAQFGFNSVWDVTPEKMPCFAICAMEKKGLLTADGKLDHDKIYDYIYHIMQPEEVRKPLVDGTEKCIKEHGQAVKIDNDPKCLQYLETGQCVHMLFHDICNN